MTEMTNEQAAAAFNSWMDEYINHPERFEREWEAVVTFLKERSGGREPTYGERCVEYLEICHKWLTASLEICHKRPTTEGPSIPVAPANREVRDGDAKAGTHVS